MLNQKNSPNIVDFIPMESHNIPMKRSCFCQDAHLQKDSWTDILMYTYNPGVVDMEIKPNKNIAEMET